MKALLEPESVTSLPDVSSWLSHAEITRRIIQDNFLLLNGESLLTATIEENILVQLEQLRTIPSVGSRLVKGDIHLHSWVYVIETGKIFTCDVESEQFVKLAEHH